MKYPELNLKKFNKVIEFQMMNKIYRICASSHLINPVKVKNAIIVSTSPLRQ